MHCILFFHVYSYVQLYIEKMITTIFPVLHAPPKLCHAPSRVEVFAPLFETGWCFVAVLTKEKVVEVTLHDYKAKSKNVIWLLPGLLSLRMLTLVTQPPCCEEAEARGTGQG